MIGLVARRGIAAVLALTAVMALTGCARVMQPGVPNPERAAITAAEAERACLGDVERRFRIVPSQLAVEKSLFDATLLSTSVVKLPPPGTVLTDVEFRALLATMGTPR